MLVSVIQEHELARSIHMSLPSWTCLQPLPHPHTILPMWIVTEHRVELPVWYSHFCWLSVLHTVMYMSQCSHSSPHLLLPCAVFTRLFSLSLLLPENMFISTIFLDSAHVCVLSHFKHVWLFATPWTIAPQAPLSMGFSRQGYWSGLPFPSPGDLPDPEVKLLSPALQADSLPTEPWGSS